MNVRFITYNNAKPSANNESQTLRNKNHQPTDECKHAKSIPFQWLSCHQINDHGKYQTSECLKQNNN